MEISESEIAKWNAEFANRSFDEIVTFSSQKFSERIAVTSSFQTQSLPLLHQLSVGGWDFPIVFLDTGFHFKETLAYRDHLMKEMNLKVHSVSKTLNHSEFLKLYGKLYKSDPDKCCFINKTMPLKDVLQHYGAWITGVRSDQTLLRSELNIFNLQKDGKVKICPMINWTQKDIFKYIGQHDLPDHPLLKEGYLSIGCQPCTTTIFDAKEGEERNGRWQGISKTECGIHRDL